MKRNVKTATVWAVVITAIVLSALWLLAAEIAPWVSAIVGLAILFSVLLGFSDKARIIADNIDSIAEKKVFGNIFTLTIMVAIFAIYVVVTWKYFWPWFGEHFPYTDQRLVLGGALLVAAFLLLPTLYLVKVAGIPVDDQSIKKSRNVVVPLIVAVTAAMIWFNPNEPLYSAETGESLVMVDPVTGDVHRDRRPGSCAKNPCYSRTTGNELEPKKPVDTVRRGVIPFLSDEQYFDLETGKPLVMWDPTTEKIHEELSPEDCMNGCWSEETGERLVPLPPKTKRPQSAGPSRSGASLVSSTAVVVGPDPKEHVVPVGTCVRFDVPDDKFASVMVRPINGSKSSADRMMIRSTDGSTFGAALNVYRLSSVKCGR